MNANKIIVYLNGEAPKEFTIEAEKPLYTYQIDAVNAQIKNKNAAGGVSLIDSLGNIIVLETWLQQLNLAPSDTPLCVV